MENPPPSSSPPTIRERLWRNITLAVTILALTYSACAIVISFTIQHESRTAENRFPPGWSCSHIRATALFTVSLSVCSCLMIPDSLDQILTRDFTTQQREAYVASLPYWKQYFLLFDSTYISTTLSCVLIGLLV